LGDEDEPEARFITLECNHILEVGGLDRWIDQDQAESSKTSVQFRCCPRCKSPIRKILRYSDTIKLTLSDITQVKRKILDSKTSQDDTLRASKVKLIGELDRLGERGAAFQDVVKALRSKVEDQEAKSATLALVAEKVSIAKLIVILEERAGVAIVRKTDTEHATMLSALQTFFYFSQRDYSKDFSAWYEELKAQRLHILGNSTLGISEEERIEINKAMNISQVGGFFFFFFPFFFKPLLGWMVF